MTSRKIIKLLQMPYAEAEAKGLSQQYKKAFKQVSKALGKQTPKKVLYEDIGYDSWNNQNMYACICPSCGLRIFEFGDNDITSEENFDGDIEKMFHSCFVHHNYQGLNNYCNRCGKKIKFI